MVRRTPPEISPGAFAATQDAIVVGAGPAGSLAARELARQGLCTLLIESKVFPREKLCGGFVNARAFNALERVGLLPNLLACSSPVQQLEVRRGRQRLSLPLPQGRIVCRATFDATLLASAMEAGVVVVTGAQAVVQPTADQDCRLVTLTRDGDQMSVRGRVVLAADGLSRSSVRKLPEFVTSVAPESRLGIGAIVADDTNRFPLGRITMVVSRHGYVGVARTHSERLNVAAALAPRALRQNGPSELVTTILDQAAMPKLPGLAAAEWRGAPLLTSRPRCVAAHRVFLLGDASGYVEPFTGEGIAAAVESAIAAVPLAVQAAENWNESLADRWTATHRRIVADRQVTSRRLSWTLRRPWAAAVALAACRLHPGLAARIVAKTGAPSTVDSPAYGVV